MKIFISEYFGTVGIALVLTGDAVFTFLMRNKSATMYYTEFGFMCLGTLFALVGLPVWASSVRASAMGWIAVAAALLLALAVLAPHIALIMGYLINTDYSAYAVGACSLPLLAAPFVLGKSWFPTSPMALSLTAATALAIYVAGYMVRVFMPSSPYLYHVLVTYDDGIGVGLVITGVLLMAIVAAISQRQRAALSEFAEDGLLKPNTAGVTYGTV